MVNFVYTQGQLTLCFSNNENITITKEHPKFRVVKEMLQGGAEEDTVYGVIMQVQKPQNVSEYVANANDGRATVGKDGNVYFKGKVVHDAVAKRIQEFMAENLPFAHLLRFMERVDQNPSYRAVNELYTFLENRGLPITDDGCFLAYKAVKNNYMDKRTGKIDNHPGKEIYMDRKEVDDNCNVHCSKGLHCGALDYVAVYGSGDDKIVVVKVDPVNVVCIPVDCSCQKCRICRYEVIRDFDGEYRKPLINSDNYAEEDDDYDDEWNDDYNDTDDYDEDDEDDDYDEDEDDYDEDYDDYWSNYGVKSNGQRYWNVREGGKFTKKV